MTADEMMVKVLEDAACHAELIAAMYGMPKEEIAAARKERDDAREAVLSALRAARKDSERLAERSWAMSVMLGRIDLGEMERIVRTMTAEECRRFGAAVDGYAPDIAKRDAAVLSSESREGTTNE